MGWSKALALAALLIGLGHAMKGLLGGSAVDWQIATLAFVSSLLLYVTAPHRAGPVAGGVVAVAAVASLAILHAYPPAGSNPGAAVEIAKIYVMNGIGAGAVAWAIKSLAARYGR